MTVAARSAGAQLSHARRKARYVRITCPALTPGAHPQEARCPTARTVCSRRAAVGPLWPTCGPGCPRCPSAQLPDATGARVGPAMDDPHAVFDDALERAVRAFQQRKGLIVDGIVGAETFSAIDGARWALGDRHPAAHPRPPAARRGRRRPCRSGSTPSGSPRAGWTAASARAPSGRCAASSAPTACPVTARSAPRRCAPSSDLQPLASPAARPHVCASGSWSAARGTA